MVMMLWSYFVVCRFFFFKQKTAYEMRISDWSSDVCSSDLTAIMSTPDTGIAPSDESSSVKREYLEAIKLIERLHRQFLEVVKTEQIGRASCRERVCQYV